MQKYWHTRLLALTSSSSSSEELEELADGFLCLTWFTFGVGSSFIEPDEGGPSIAFCANALNFSFSFVAVTRASASFAPSLPSSLAL